MKLTRNLELSIDLLSTLTADPKTASQIGEELRISEAYVHRIANRLARRGLCNSIRGWGGGYIKTRPIQVSELIKLTTEPSERKSFDTCEAINSTLDALWI